MACITFLGSLYRCEKYWTKLFLSQKKSLKRVGRRTELQVQDGLSCHDVRQMPENCRVFRTATCESTLKQSYGGAFWTLLKIYDGASLQKQLTAISRSNGYHPIKGYFCVTPPPQMFDRFLNTSLVRHLGEFAFTQFAKCITQNHVQPLGRFPILNIRPGLSLRFSTKRKITYTFLIFEGFAILDNILYIFHLHAEISRDFCYMFRSSVR